MPRTSTKRKTQSQTSECTNNLCIQQAQAIGDLQAKASNNESRIDGLEDKLTSIVDMITNNHTEALNNSKSIGEVLSAIKTVLDHQKENQETMLADNKEIKEKVSNVEKDIVKVKADIASIKKDNANIKENHTNWEKKVNKLERISIFLYALGVIIAGIAMIIIYWNDIAKIIHNYTEENEPKQKTTFIQPSVIVPNNKTKVQSDK